MGWSIALSSPRVRLFAFRSDPEEQKSNSQLMKHLDESVTLIDEIRQAYAGQCAVH